MSVYPITPLPRPLKNPSTPSFFAPFTGSSTSPVTPLNNPNLKYNKHALK